MSPLALPGVRGPATCDQVASGVADVFAPSLLNAVHQMLLMK